MSPIETITVIFISLIVFISLILLIVYLVNPYKYPYTKINFDVSGTRNPNMDDYIDNYLIKYGLSEVIKAEKKSNYGWKIVVKEQKISF